MKIGFDYSRDRGKTLPRDNFPLCGSSTVNGHGHLELVRADSVPSSIRGVLFIPIRSKEFRRYFRVAYHPYFVLFELVFQPWTFALMTIINEGNKNLIRNLVLLSRITIPILRERFSANCAIERFVFFSVFVIFENGCRFYPYSNLVVINNPFIGKNREEKRLANYIFVAIIDSTIF